MRSVSLGFLLGLVSLLPACGGNTETKGSGDGDGDGDGGGSSVSSCSSDRDCSDDVFCNGQATCAPSDRSADARGCVAGEAACEDGQICDETSKRCSTACDVDADADGDGFDAVECGGDDCDDSDVKRYPGNTEVCDSQGHDEDCDPNTVGDQDEDGDGLIDRACCNSAEGDDDPVCGTDCDDSRAGIFPGATEVCNGVDDDCDDVVDEELPVEQYVPDCDGDDFGDAKAEAIGGCTAPEVAPSCAGGAWVTVATDCDDTRAATNPGASEICNGIDDDCNDEADDGLTFRSYYPDCDIDNYGDESATPISACEAPAMAPSCPGGVWVTVGADCDDARASANPVAAETCNDLDDDCDIDVDEGLPFQDYLPDCDNDSYGDSSAEPVNACRTPNDPPTCLGPGGGWSQATGDCDDEDGNRSPGKIEVCDYVDNDCNDGILDEEYLATFESLDERLECAGDAFGVAKCDTAPVVGGDFALEATLLDGSANNTAGAVWLTPSDLVTGFGPVEITVELEVRAVPANGSADSVSPNGGWAVVFATGGPLGVGTPQQLGVPSGLTGIAAKWHWSSYYYCPSGPPPGQGDVVGYSLLNGARRCREGSNQFDWSCHQGDPVAGDFDGGTSWQTQTLTLRYTPDDPRTTPNEEVVEMGGYTFVGDEPLGCGPSNDLPVGSNIRIGLTAGTFTDTGFDGPPDGFTFGVPVEAKVRMFRFQAPTGPGDPTFDQERAVLSREGLCSP